MLDSRSHTIPNVIDLMFENTIHLDERVSFILGYDDIDGERMRLLVRDSR